MTIVQRENAFMDWLKAVPNKAGGMPMSDSGAKDYRSHLRHFRNKFSVVDLDGMNAPGTIFSFSDSVKFSTFFMSLRALPQFAVQAERDHHGLRTAMERYLEFLRSGNRA